MCIPQSQSRIQSRTACLLLSCALPSRALLNPGEYDDLRGSTSLTKGKMIVKFTGSASRMQARISSCRIGRGVRPGDRTAWRRSGVVSLEVIAGVARVARVAEDIIWEGQAMLGGSYKPSECIDDN